MKRPVVLSLCAWVAAVVPAHGELERRPVVQHAPAEATIDRQPAGRRLVTLPGIEFPLRVQPACAPGLTLDSLSISIADTRRTYRAADFDEEAVIETTLRIPRRQAGPLGIDGFCASDTTMDDGPSTAHVADAYTASVSMRCANDATQSVVYDTLALDITLRCAATESDAAADESEFDALSSDKTLDDQDASSSMTRF